MADTQPCPNAPCQQREGMLRAEIGRLNARIGVLETLNQTNATKIRDLEREKRELLAKNAGHGKHTERTWPHVLRTYLRNSHPVPKVYEKIYRLSCKEENMSVKLKCLHPDLELVPSRRRNRANSPSEGDDGIGLGVILGAASARDAEQDKGPFPFEKLPWQIQAKILKLVLHKPGRVIHCISRLDPFVQPDEFPTDEELGEFRSGLVKRFFWNRHCSITSGGEDPNKVLGILTVSKRFYFLGVHIFYGLNTFAFSSLGEFGRFCQGSGAARIARVQHIELLLTGNQYLTCAPDERQKVPMSRRTYPLSWFAETYRLKTLVVFINETGRQYIRRGYENPMIKGLLGAKMRGQPNRRMSRSLRCVQGIDYIYQLRGLDWIRFYDLQPGRRDRTPIQDWSFAEDITNTSTMPKPPKRQEYSELEKLASLFHEEDPSWTPSPDDWELAKSVYIESNGRCSYDDLRIQRQNHDADLASYLTVTGSGSVSDDSSGDSDSNSDSDNSGSSSDSGASSSRPPLPRHRQRRLQRQRSQSPLFVSSGSDADSDTDSDLDSDSDTDSDSDSSASNSAIELSSDPDDSDDSEDSSDSDSDSSSSPNSIASSSTRKSFSEVLSQFQANRSRSLPGTPGPNGSTPGAAHARRASTASGIFVTPGPANRAARTPPHVKRASTAASGLFVTPAPASLALQIKTDEKSPVRDGPGGGNANSNVVDLTVDDGNDADAVMGNTTNPARTNTNANGAANKGFQPLSALFENTSDPSSSDPDSDDDDTSDSDSNSDSDADTDSDDDGDGATLAGAKTKNKAKAKATAKPKNNHGSGSEPGSGHGPESIIISDSDADSNSNSDSDNDSDNDIVPSPSSDRDSLFGGSLSGSLRGLFSGRGSVSWGGGTKGLKRSRSGSEVSQGRESPQKRARSEK